MKYFINIADEIEVALPSCSDAINKYHVAIDILRNSHALIEPHAIFSAFSDNKLKLARDLSNALYYGVAKDWYLVAWNTGDMANMITTWAKNHTASAF